MGFWASKRGWRHCLGVVFVAMFSGALPTVDAATPDAEFARHLTPAERQWLERHDVIRHTGDPHWMPFESFDNNDRYTGIVSDLLQEIQTRTGLRVEVVQPDSWLDAIDMVARDDVDTVSATTAHRAVAANFDATRPYLSSNVVIVTRDGHPPINHLMQLAEKKIGLVQGYAYVPILREAYPDIAFIEVETVASGFADVQTGRLHALLSTNIVAREHFANQGFDDLVVSGSTNVYLSATIFVSRKLPRLQSIIEKALQDIDFEKRNAIFDRWMAATEDTPSVALTGLALNDSERAWLDQHSPFTLAGDPDWLPFEAFDQNGNYIGMVAEHLQLIEQLLDIDIDVKRTTAWVDSIALARRGEIDILSETVDSDLDEILTFSKSYLASPIVIVMQRDAKFAPDLQSVAHLRLGVVHSYGYVPKIKRAYQDTKLVEFPTLRDGLIAVSTGELDVMLCSLAQCSYQIPRESLNNLRIVGRTNFDTRLALGVRPELAPLVPLLNRALTAIGTPQQQRIRTTWARDPSRDLHSDRGLYWFIGIALALAALGGLRSVQLLRKVRERGRQAQALMVEKNQAIAASQAKSEFLAAMSHEVRTPMNGVLGLIEILSHTALDRRQSETVSYIRQSAQALLAIIDDLLDLSRIEAGDMKISLEVTRLGNLVESVVSTYAVVAQKKNLTVRLDIDPALNRGIMIDPIRVRQILSNFLSNAIKFTTHGHVSVVARLTSQDNTGPEFALWVEDTGIGIDAAHQEKLFKRFTQADDSIALRFGGTGLGLSICQELAGLMNGQLSLDSEPERGTKIEYRQQAQWAATEDRAPSAPGPYTAVMLVDDAAERDILTQYLNALELRVHVATDQVRSVQQICDCVTASRASVLIIPSGFLAALGATSKATRSEICAQFACPVVVLMHDATVGESDFSPMLSCVAANPLLPSSFSLAIRVCLGDTLMELPHSPAPERSRHAHILIVEDHPINQSVLRTQLEFLGYSCELADDGDAGLAAWRRGQFDAIITDCAMPKMDGYTMTEHIRKSEPDDRPAIPIIGLTASSIPGEAYRCRDAGMDDCLFKPLELAQVDSSLTHWLERRPRASDDDPTTLLSLIDVPHLKKMFQSDATVHEMLEEFVRVSHENLEEIAQLLAQDDVAQVRQKAHYIAGAAATMKAGELTQLGRRLSDESNGLSREELERLAEMMRNALSDYSTASRVFMARTVGRKETTV